MTEHIREVRELGWSLGNNEDEHELPAEVMRQEVEALRRVLLQVLVAATEDGKYSVAVRPETDVSHDWEITQTYSDTFTSYGVRRKA